MTRSFDPLCSPTVHSSLYGDVGEPCRARCWSLQGIRVCEAHQERISCEPYFRVTPLPWGTLLFLSRLVKESEKVSIPDTSTVLEDIFLTEDPTKSRPLIHHAKSFRGAAVPTV